MLSSLIHRVELVPEKFLIPIIHFEKNVGTGACLEGGRVGCST